MVMIERNGARYGERKGVRDGARNSGRQEEKRKGEERQLFLRYHHHENTITFYR